MSDTYVQTESGLFVRKPTGREVTMIRIADTVPDVQVIESLDEVRAALTNPERTAPPVGYVVRFTDMFGQPVDIYPYARIQATYIQYADEEDYELEQKERALTKKLKAAQLQQAGLDAAKASRNARQYN